MPSLYCGSCKHIYYLISFLVITSSSYFVHRYGTTDHSVGDGPDYENNLPHYLSSHSVIQFDSDTTVFCHGYIYHYPHLESVFWEYKYSTNSFTYLDKQSFYLYGKELVAAWKFSSNEVLTFGGKTFHYPMNEVKIVTIDFSSHTLSGVETLCGNTGKISVTDGPSTIPGSRYSTVKWDFGSGIYAIFGGYGYEWELETYRLLNSLWVLEIVDGSCQWSILSPVGLEQKMNDYETPYPGERRHSSSWDVSDSVHYLYGGIGYCTATYSETDVCSDLWRYDSSSNTFSLVNEYHKKLLKASSNVVIDNNYLVLYGGLDEADIINLQMYLYDISDSKWILLPTDSYPGGRYYSAMSTSSDGSPLIFGGMYFNNELYEDIWTMSLCVGTVCTCEGDETGISCITSTCFGIDGALSYEVCSGGRGQCVTEDDCLCFDGYDGDQCELIVCFQVNSNVEEVCSGRGNCTFPDYCECGFGYYGENCEVMECFDYLSNETDKVCSSNGICIERDNCSCNSESDGSECQYPFCYSISGANLDDVCSGQGSCEYADVCLCNDNYYWRNCSITTCYGVVSFDEDACGIHGVCTFFDSCECSSRYYGSECNVWSCNGIFSNDSSVCGNGNGSCVDFNNCSCNEGYYGLDCEMWNCDGMMFNDSAVCSFGNGSCIGPDACSCRPGFSGSNCDEYDCDGILFSQTDYVCHGNGVCVSVDLCDCNEGYNGTFCSFPICDQWDSRFSSQVCSGHGSCYHPETCDCQAGYEGDYCGTLTSHFCYGIVSSHDLVCSGEGNCTSNDNCTCVHGYYGHECQLWRCNGAESNSTSVCSGFGTCVASEVCVCDSYYDGKYCNITKCYGIWSNSSDEVCGGAGDCKAYDHCECCDGYFGEHCNITTCFGRWNNETGTCSEFGECVDLDVCLCNDGFSGETCRMFIHNPLPDLVAYLGEEFSEKIPVSSFGQTERRMIYMKIVGNPSWLNIEQTPPQKINSVDLLERMYNMRVRGNVLIYSTLSEEKFVFMDISNRTDPVYHSHRINVAGQSNHGLFLDDEHVILLFGDGKAQIFDISNISDPLLVHEIPEELIPWGEYNDDGYAYFTSGGNGQTDYFHIFDLSNFSNPVQISKTMMSPDGDSYPMTINFQDDLVFVGFWNSPSSDKLFIYNVSDKEQPSYVGKYIHAYLVGGVEKFGDYLIVSTQGWGVGKLQVLDVSDLSNPMWVSEYNTITMYREVLDGEFVYLAAMEEGFQILDVSDIPSTPQHLYTVYPFDVTDDFCLQENYAYVKSSDYQIYVVRLWDHLILEGTPNEDDCGKTFNVTVVAYDGSGKESISVNFSLSVRKQYHHVSLHGECILSACFGVKANDTVVCNHGNGSCVNEDTCECNEGYYGPECGLWNCYEFMYNETDVVCGGKGSCLYPDSCVCDEGFYGENGFCENWDCYGIQTNSSDVCSSRGDCIAPNECMCDRYYFGVNCNITTCLGIFSNDSKSVCSGHSCWPHDNCNCFDDFFGEDCNITTCFGIFSNDTEKVCNGKGVCGPNPDNCSCEVEGYEGNDCADYHCFFKNKDSEEVCNFLNGSCVSPNNCSCNYGYFGKECGQWECDGINSNDSFVCNFRNGSCISPGVCACSTGYFGSSCEKWACDEIDHQNLDYVCHGNGICESPNSCVCEEGWNGTACFTPVCQGRDAQDGLECSGHGTCVSPEVCDCNSDYYGSTCEFPSCFGLFSNQENVCSGHGNCTSVDVCDCDSGYHVDSESACNLWYCGGVMKNDTENVCNRRGTCEKPEFCTCDLNYYPSGLNQYCDQFDCFDFNKDDSKVCNHQNGTCVDHNNCSCSDGFYDAECLDWDCDEIHHTDQGVCNGHGKCASPEFCSCEANYLPYGSGFYCNIWNCYGKNRSDTEVCNNGNGTCVSHNNCSCSSGYYGASCDLWSCNDYLFNDSDTCNSSGSCIGPEKCKCTEGYSGTYCEDYSCFGITFTHPLTCTGHGECSSPDECVCDGGYNGTKCQYSICTGYDSTFTDYSCNGHGSCAGPNSCVCFSNWIGNDCEFPRCFGIYSNEQSVCSGHGNCTDVDQCSCESGYDIEPNCDFWKCNNVMNNDTDNVCSGRGTCSSPGKCENCLYDSYGSWCENYDCFGILYDDPSVCNYGNGTCDCYYHCNCSSGYTGNECEDWKCDEIAYEELGTVCDGHGVCVSPDRCECVNNYDFAPFCNIFKCYGIFSNESSVCNIGNGTCSSHDNCSCDSGYFGDECEFWECDEELYLNHSSVCNFGNGSCVAPEICDCNTGYSDTYCTDFVCYGLDSEQPLVCHGHGDCILYDTCVCDQGYNGTECEFPVCHDSQTQEGCGFHGDCINPDVCNCEDEYDGNLCQYPSCFGFFSYQTSSVCSGHGNCTSLDSCECDSGFHIDSDEVCNLWYCDGAMRNDTENVCNRRGTCDSPETCTCNPNYYPSGLNNYCDQFDCGFYNKDDSEVCNHQNGTCIDYDNCSCNGGYYGSECQDWDCDGYHYLEEGVCGGHGHCLEPEVCLCLPNYDFSEWCDVYECHGVLSNDSSVCNYENGTCESYNFCNCIGDYEGASCDLWYCDGLLFNDTNTCNASGSCVGPQDCKCVDGYSGTYCEEYSCFGISFHHPLTCYGNGECVSPNDCVCDGGYNGSECLNPICNGFDSTFTNDSCSGRGTCTAPNSCVCHENWGGHDCEYPKCYGIFANEISVCSGNGNCTCVDTCLCKSGFHSPSCDDWKCDGIWKNDTNNVCSGRGICVDFDECICHTNYYPSGFNGFCLHFDCYSENKDDPEACSGENGTCIDYNVCNCTNGYYGSQCESWKCNNIEPHFAAVCDSHGSCISPETCSCLPSYSGDFCSEWNCSEISHLDSRVCNFGNGTCLGHNNCSCIEGYTSQDCGMWKCSGYRFNDSNACSGSNGSCVSPETCKCKEGYYGRNCESWSCGGIEKGNDNVCQGHGNCFAFQSCQCWDGWNGTECAFPMCQDRDGRDYKACSVRGICYLPETCDCDDTSFGQYCESSWNVSCFGIASSEFGVCSAHGMCYESNLCQCQDHFYGMECSESIKNATYRHSSGKIEIEHCIFFEYFKDSFVDFVRPGASKPVIDRNDFSVDCVHILPNFSEEELNCSQCYFQFITTEVNVTNVLVVEVSSCFLIGQRRSSSFSQFLDELEYVDVGRFYEFTLHPISSRENENITILIHVLPSLDTEDDDDKNSDDGNQVSSSENFAWVFGLLIPFGFLCVFFLVCSVLLVICVLFLLFLAIIVIIGLFGSIYTVIRNRGKLRKFGQLEDVDIIIKEQEIDRESGTMDLKFDRSVFKIDMGDIKLIQELGKGGSGSVVYLADSKDFGICALKVLKTKDICNRQNDVDTLTEELNVCIKAIHPNIIRFFGSSLKGNRIGYLMEYCSNGEIGVYIQKKPGEIPLGQKLDWLIQICRGMQFLHSKNILHRDLKCENVLLDSNLDCKIMDFGLSRLFKTSKITKLKKTTRIGTSIYMSPEIIISSIYNGKTDVFSFGIMIYMICEEEFDPYEFTFGPNSNLGVELKVANDPDFRPKYPNNSITPKWLQNLSIGCWQHDMRKRKHFIEISELIERKYKSMKKKEKKKRVKVKKKVVKKKKVSKNGGEEIIISILENDESDDPESEIMITKEEEEEMIEKYEEHIERIELMKKKLGIWDALDEDKQKEIIQSEKQKENYTPMLVSEAINFNSYQSYLEFMKQSKKENIEYFKLIENVDILKGFENEVMNEVKREFFELKQKLHIHNFRNTMVQMKQHMIRFKKNLSFKQKFFHEKYEKFRKKIHEEESGSDLEKLKAVTELESSMNESRRNEKWKKELENIEEKIEIFNGEILSDNIIIEENERKIESLKEQISIMEEIFFSTPEDELKIGNFVFKILLRQNEDENNFATQNEISKYDILKKKIPTQIRRTQEFYQKMFYGTFFSDTHDNITNKLLYDGLVVLERMEGTINDIMEKKKSLLTIENIIGILKEIAICVKYFHESGFVLNYISPQNIGYQFIHSGNNRVKLCLKIMNLSRLEYIGRRIIYDSKNEHQQQQNNLSINNNNNNMKYFEDLGIGQQTTSDIYHPQSRDIYSFGMLIYCLCFKGLPYEYWYRNKYLVEEINEKMKRGEITDEEYLSKVGERLSFKPYNGYENLKKAVLDTVLKINSNSTDKKKEDMIKREIDVDFVDLLFYSYKDKKLGEKEENIRRIIERCSCKDVGKRFNITEVLREIEKLEKGMKKKKEEEEEGEETTTDDDHDDDSDDDSEEEEEGEDKPESESDGSKEDVQEQEDNTTSDSSSTESSDESSESLSSEHVDDEDEIDRLLNEEEEEEEDQEIVRNISKYVNYRDENGFDEFLNEED